MLRAALLCVCFALAASAFKHQVSGIALSKDQDAYLDNIGFSMFVQEAGRALLQRRPADRKEAFQLIAEVMQENKGGILPDGDAVLVPSPEEAELRFSNECKKAECNKGIWNYHTHYGRYMAPWLNRRVRLLEIGVMDGGSLKMWQKLFPKHDLVAGLTIGKEQTANGRLLAAGKDGTSRNLFKQPYGDNAVVYIGDQSKAADLERVWEDVGHKQFDIIIDDGSHVPWHQVFTFEQIFKWIAPGGLYIIEDVETSYWDRVNASLYGYPVKEGGIGKRGSAVEKFKQVADVVNRKFLGTRGKPSAYSAVDGDHDVASLAFAQNCIILQKHRHVSARRAGDYFRDHRLDHSRAHYKSYAAEAAWKVAGTPPQEPLKKQ